MAHWDVLRVLCGEDGHGGIPLGVVLDSSDPPSVRQDLAARLGSRETVFGEDRDAGRIRRFAARPELPFAEHPVVGIRLVIIMLSGFFLVAGCGAAGEVDDAERAVEGSQEIESGLCVAAEQFVEVNRDFWHGDLALDASVDEVRHAAALAEDAIVAIEELRTHAEQERFDPLFDAWHDSFTLIIEAYREVDYDLSRLEDPEDNEAWRAFDEASTAVGRLASDDMDELAEAFGAQIAERCGLTLDREPDATAPHPEPTDQDDESGPDAQLTLSGAMVTTVGEYIELARDGELGTRPCPLWDENALAQQLGTHVDDMEVVPSRSMGWSVAGDDVAFTCSMELMEPGRTSHIATLVTLTAAMPATGHDPTAKPLDVDDHGQVGYHVEDDGGSMIHALTVVDSEHDIQITIESSEDFGGRDIVGETLDAILGHLP